VNDPGKERIRMWLLGLDDAQLQSGLGLRPEDMLSYAAVVHEICVARAL